MKRSLPTKNSHSFLHARPPYGGWERSAGLNKGRSCKSDIDFAELRPETKIDPPYGG